MRAVFVSLTTAEFDAMTSDEFDYLYTHGTPLSPMACAGLAVYQPGTVAGVAVSAAALAGVVA